MSRARWLLAPRQQHFAPPAHVRRAAAYHPRVTVADAATQAWGLSGRLDVACQADVAAEEAVEYGIIDEVIDRRDLVDNSGPIAAVE